VTTVVLIAPVTILICEILGLNSQPYLMAEALLSNTGVLPRWWAIHPTF
jgi:Na+/H+ antiporter NhaD/arsenite permease-like protein